MISLLDCRNRQLYSFRWSLLQSLSTLLMLSTELNSSDSKKYYVSVRYLLIGSACIFSTRVNQSNTQAAWDLIFCDLNPYLGVITSTILELTYEPMGWPTWSQHYRISFPLRVTTVSPRQFSELAMIACGTWLSRSSTTTGFRQTRIIQETIFLSTIQTTVADYLYSFSDNTARWPNCSFSGRWMLCSGPKCYRNSADGLEIRSAFSGFSKIYCWTNSSIDISTSCASSLGQSL